MISVERNLLIYNQKKRRKLLIDDIEQIVADVNYSIIFLKYNKKITVSRTLKIFEKLLQPFDFMRINQTQLIAPKLILGINQLGEVYDHKNQKIGKFSRRQFQNYKLKNQ